ncbi:hypothetical protein NHQ30_009218 [Ciborinia camelliae]|nr:hypothetical protein NHQ30_009218 [Ciborinia camelliae]
MERIPQEVLNRIVELLPDRHEHKLALPALATVSRAWQQAAERLTFRSLHINSKELDIFTSVFSSTSMIRRRFLRNLKFDILLPSYSDAACANYETEHNRTANSDVASLHISSAIQQLSQWPTDGNLSFIINIYSPMDSSHRGQEKLIGDMNAAEMGSRQDIFGERYRYSYIRLSNTDYPSVPCVTSFMPPQGTTRFLDPSSLVKLTATFPNLQRINWPHQDPGFFLPLCRQHIKEFAESISTYQVPATSKILDIKIETAEYPHNQRIPNLAGTTGETSLCDALRTMIGKSKLEKIYYEGPIDPSLFWPDDGSEIADFLDWRSVVELRIQFNMASLSGQWFFKGTPNDQFYEERSDVPLPQDTAGIFPPGYGSEENTVAAKALVDSMKPPTDEDGFLIDSYEFRRIPRDEAMIPMLEALARRLSHMSSLRSAYLETRLPQDRGEWFFSYGAPGESCGFEEYMEEPDTDLLRARVFFHTEDWRPGDEIVRMFRGVGKACHGEDAIVTFLPFLY